MLLNIVRGFGIHWRRLLLALLNTFGNTFNNRSAMILDEIREQLANKIMIDLDVWNDVLNDTTPGNYGCNHWDASVDYQDIYVNIPERTFVVNSGSFSANLVMGASKGEHSFNENYSKPFSANGKFDFKNSKEIIITEISIDIDSDIYGG
ncbi:hypothetical protein GTQ34_13635 [Muricauda sp. JGD-17]|uniref:Uncharacterized protein n=1 Tax=Flagellimonas ochracea TaxID=2696472 RepID=A0A964TDQ0_9FLAO|nr:hypothetical protein [Allomuricauda ochracea]NAY92960.1 hypothetical protein [Allomuricauda ochracea]